MMKKKKEKKKEPPIKGFWISYNSAIQTKLFLFKYLEYSNTFQNYVFLDNPISLCIEISKERYEFAT